MSKKFAGMNAIVTGASRGIGANTALRLAAEGANVAITARTVIMAEGTSSRPSPASRRS